MASPHHDDYPRAARRHLVDATVLKTRQRYDGAAYLAGYVVECSLKALIKAERGQVDRTHDLSRLHDTLTRLICLADARTARLAEPLVGLLRRPGVLAWDPQMRYRTSEVGADQAQRWVLEAQVVYSAVIGAMTMDGLIP